MNLLPDKARQNVAAEYRLKLLFVGALLLFFVACVALLALLPALLISFGERTMKEVSVLEMRSEQLKKDRADAQETQALIISLRPLATSTTLLERTLSEALRVRPEGINVNAISYEGEGSGTMVLSGTSQNRNTLNTYRSSLEDIDLFSRVSVPVGVLVGTASSFFSITLTLK